MFHTCHLGARLHLPQAWSYGDMIDTGTAPVEEAIGQLARLLASRFATKPGCRAAP